MAVISLTSTDEGFETKHWSVPPDPQLVNTPIPRGLRNYQGTKAVPALGSGDQSAVDIKLEFPTAFIYLMKNFQCNFISDDITSEFNNIGVLQYLPGGSGAIGVMQQYVLLSEGQAFTAAVRSIQVYRPLGTWRQWIDGTDGSNIHFQIQDMSGDASTAGDVGWTAEFWEYDVEQCLKWPVNTPVPQISY